MPVKVVYLCIMRIANLISKHLEEEDEEEREVRLQNQGKAWWTLDKACKNLSLRKSFGMTTLQSQSAHYDLWGRDGRGPRGCNGHPHRCGRILAGRTGAKQTSSRYGEGISRECSTSGRTVRLPCVDTWTRGSKATVRCRRPTMA